MQDDEDILTPQRTGLPVSSVAMELQERQRQQAYMLSRFVSEAKASKQSDNDLQRLLSGAVVKSLRSMQHFFLQVRTTTSINLNTPFDQPPRGVNLARHKRQRPGGQAAALACIPMPR